MGLGRTEDKRAFLNEDLVLRVKPHDPKQWDESRYEAFLDELCGEREYQKNAIRAVLSYWLGAKYANLSELAKENFKLNDELNHRWGRWDAMASHLQLPEKLSCSLDLATGTGKSYVLYGVAVIMLAEGAVDRVLLLCPSNTIEYGLTTKFKELATNATLRDALPNHAKVKAPHVINASESIVNGSICIENYHAILDHVSSSIRDSLAGAGARVAVLNDEAHHIANESGQAMGRWKEFLLSESYGFRYVLGVSGTCYVGDEYFSDVVLRYSLRQAIEERFVKRIEYLAEMPPTNGQEDRWQLIWQRHEDWKRKLKSRVIRPLTIVVTAKIITAKQVAEELVDWLSVWEQISVEDARAKVLVVTSAKEHQLNVAMLRKVDDSGSKIEWIISVAMLSEGWDVKNVFQIVPHEERAFNSKLLIAQVLGRGLRRPVQWSGDEPMVTVFNHDSWSGRIKHLVNEVLEIERRLTSGPVKSSPYNFDLHNLDYAREEEATEHPQRGEYLLFQKGFVVLPSQVAQQAVTLEFEDAVTGKNSRFKTSLQRRTFSDVEVADQLYRRLKSIDQETAALPNPNDRTEYSKRFNRERCMAIVTESLKQAGILDQRITDENRQKFLQAIGPLHRKGTKRVIYSLKAKALNTWSTASRHSDSCSAAELRRGSKTVFYSDGAQDELPEEQQEFFAEVIDPDGEFVNGRVEIGNPADFKVPMNLVIADATPERKFIRELTRRENALQITSWIKNSAVGFFNVEYAWKKGEHTKRSQFSPDFLIKQGDVIFVVEIKDDFEIKEPAPENVKKHEFATTHFMLLNKWLEAEKNNVRYQFNMLSPKDYGGYCQKLREGSLVGFRSQLDVTMLDGF